MEFGNGVAVVPESMHLVHLVSHGQGDESQAKRVAAWYHNAFGAEELYHTIHEAIDGIRTEIHCIYYMRIGPVGSGIILEVRDSFGNDDGPNDGNIICFVSSLNIGQLRDNIQNTTFDGGVQPVIETIVETGNHSMHKITDPYGFSWIIGSSSFLPNEIFEWNQPSVGGGGAIIHSAHLMYLVDHPRAVEACQWYQEAFGCSVVHEVSDTIGISGNITVCKTRYLTLGQGNKRTILEIKDSIRPPVEQSDDKALGTIYTKFPNDLHNQIIGLQGTNIMINQSRGLFISQIIDPFGFRWFIKTTLPNM